MSKNLFPVFEMPEVVTPLPAQEQKYKPSLHFDITTGDFLRDGANRIVKCTGREAFMQWCVKVCHTERGACLAYGKDIGVELEDALSQAGNTARESALERTITEALMVNSRTEYVRGFSFAHSADEIICSFDVKGKEWEEFRIQLNYPMERSSANGDS